MVGCAALKCTNSSDKNEAKKFSFVRFPKEKRLFEIWTRACGNIKISKNARLCTEHFDTDQFIRALNTTKLLDCAVPTIFAFENEPVEKIMFTTAMDTKMDPVCPIRVPLGDVKRIFNSNEFNTTKSIELNKITPLRAPVINKRSIFFCYSIYLTNWN